LQRCAIFDERSCNSPLPSNDDGEVHDDVSIDSKEEECNEEEDRKGSESPEKTVEELMADGWDYGGQRIVLGPHPLPLMN
jgi:hypothetical protein